MTDYTIRIPGKAWAAVDGHGRVITWEEGTLIERSLDVLKDEIRMLRRVGRISDGDVEIISISLERVEP